MDWLRRLLAAEMNDVEISEYDPDQRGRPPGTFEWSIYDLLILGQELGEFENGLDWLEHFRGRRGFPPVLFLARDVDAYVSARAIKLGAGEFLLKSDITPDRLLSAIKEARRALRENAPGLETADSEAKPATLSDQPDGGLTLDFATAPEEYVFTRLIGQGAMSRIYLARRLADGELVVVKTIKSELLTVPRIRKRFVQEAEIARSVPSDHLIETYHYHVSVDYGIMSMEFLPGGDLKQRKERGVTPADAIDYTRQMAKGVGALWNAQVVHRDLKPGNIMFRNDRQLVIADFGIAKRLNEGLDLTVEGKVLGTPAYMSPEQFLGRELDTRSDLYALGVMFYEMLTGRRPFTARSIQALMYQHVHAPAPRLPEILSPLQPVMDRLLAKDPAGRFDDASALDAALDAVPQPLPTPEAADDTFTSLPGYGRR